MKPTSPGPEGLDDQRLGREDTDPVDLMDGARAHHLHLHALLEHALAHPQQGDDAEIGIVPAIDDQGLQGGGGIALGRRQAVDHGLQHGVDAKPGLGRDHQGVGGVEADDVLDLLLDPVGLGRRQVDLVQDRHDLVVGLDRLVRIGQGLRLDPLARIDQQQRALARAERAADLVGEVDMARRVDEVEDVVPAVLRLVEQADGLRLDGDAALALDIHRVEHLLLHLAVGETTTGLDQPVGQGRLAMVDMSDDGEIADMREVGHAVIARFGEPSGCHAVRR